jgi:hypothetical protein
MLGRCLELSVGLARSVLIVAPEGTPVLIVPTS